MSKVKLLARRTLSAPTDLARLHEFEKFVPLGHYYSPDISQSELQERERELFRAPEAATPGIDLRVPEQLALLDRIGAATRGHGFPKDRTEGHRYWSVNGFYTLGDTLTLIGMIKLHRSKRVVEVGSGFSSAAMLDARDRLLDFRPELTFIEPYPADRLDGLLRESDRASTRVLKTFVQQAPMDCFTALEAGDILLIDSSHVSKVGSDVNFLFFEVLPNLKPGVLVHVHDVFVNFEYPRHWFVEGRNWNEDYLLRAFLMYNSAFRVEYFTNYLSTLHRDRFVSALGIDAGEAQRGRTEDLGASLWFSRCA